MKNTVPLSQLTKFDSIDKTTDKNIHDGEVLRAMTTHCSAKEKRPRHMQFISPRRGTTRDTYDRH
jgi:hypothetical protein